MQNRLLRLAAGVMAIAGAFNLPEIARSAWERADDDWFRTGLFVVGIALLIVAYRTEVGRFLGFPADAAMRRDIERWFVSLGWVPDGAIRNLPDNVAFRVDGELKTGDARGVRQAIGGVTVVRHKGQLLTFGHNMVLREETAAAIAALGDKERIELLLSISDRAVANGCTYQFDGGDKPTKITFEKVIWVGDGLTESAFLSGVQSVHSARVMADNTIRVVLAK